MGSGADCIHIGNVEAYAYELNRIQIEGTNDYQEEIIPKPAITIGEIISRNGDAINITGTISTGNAGINITGSVEVGEAPAISISADLTS